MLSDAQIDQLFLKIDADGSGEIDVYELLDFLTKQVICSHSHLPNLAHSSLTQQPDLGHRHSSIDTAVLRS